MDGIGRMGGAQNLSGMRKAPKASFPKSEIANQPIKDGVVSGAFTGSEIQDPRKAFEFGGSEIKDPVAALEGNKSPEIQTEAGTDIASIEGRYLSGVGQDFSDLDLSGPSSGLIISLSGTRLAGGNPNPTVLLME